VNAHLLSMLQLEPEESDAVRLLATFAAGHPGVTIITPHHHDEPWRAEIREGMVPGEPRATSAILTARHPSELLVKLEKLFPDSDVEDAPG
jgi:hypothetical protein